LASSASSASTPCTVAQPIARAQRPASPSAWMRAGSGESAGWSRRIPLTRRTKCVAPWKISPPIRCRSASVRRRTGGQSARTVRRSAPQAASIEGGGAGGGVGGGVGGGAGGPTSPTRSSDGVAAGPAGMTAGAPGAGGASLRIMT
jgi:hypothetical protein